MLRKREEGAALVEGILSLLLFLPVWMFIIYIGNAGFQSVDIYQAIRAQSLWQAQASFECLGTNSMDISALQATPGALGTSASSFSVDQDNGNVAITGYAAMMGEMGFPTSSQRQTISGCASYESTLDEPGLASALGQINPSF